MLFASFFLSFFLLLCFVPLSFCSGLFLGSSVHCLFVPCVLRYRRYNIGLDAVAGRMGRRWGQRAGGWKLVEVVAVEQGGRKGR